MFLLEKYDHLLLDMNGTFVFDFDNFGLDQNFGRTYREAGYTALSESEAQAYVRSGYDHLAVRYIDEAYYACFPSLEESLRATGANSLPNEVVQELVCTFALHEMGIVPSAHKQSLERLAEHKPLSVLSNLWSPKAMWLAAFKTWGINELFKGLHFSSDGATMKPHPSFFGRAIAAIHADQPDARILYVGDSYRCDVKGAQAAGLDVVWLSKGNPLPASQIQVATYRDLVAFERDCLPL